MTTQVTFRDFASTDALDAYIRSKAEKLGHFHPRMTACRVSLESPHRHHQHGNHVRVRLDLTVPGAELVVDHDAGEAAKDAYAAVDDAFKTAERVLKAHAQKTREGRRA